LYDIPIKARHEEESTHPLEKKLPSPTATQPQQTTCNKSKRNHHAEKRKEGGKAARNKNKSGKDYRGGQKRRQSLLKQTEA